MSLRDQLADLAAFAVSTDYLGTPVTHRIAGQPDQALSAVIDSDPTADIADSGAKGYTARRRAVVPTAGFAPIPKRSFLIIGADTFVVTDMSVGEFFTTLHLEQTTRQNFGGGKT